MKFIQFDTQSSGKGHARCNFQCTAEFKRLHTLHNTDDRITPEVAHSGSSQSEHCTPQIMDSYSMSKMEDRLQKKTPHCKSTIWIYIWSDWSEIFF